MLLSSAAVLLACLLATAQLCSAAVIRLLACSLAELLHSYALVQLCSAAVLLSSAAVELIHYCAPVQLCLATEQCCCYSLACLLVVL